MHRVTRHRLLDADALAGVLVPRDDVVLERPLGDGVFEAAEGPLEHYRRTVSTDPGADGLHEVTERFEYRLAIPVWRVLFSRPFGRVLRSDSTTRPWWHPPDRFTARQAQVTALVATLAVLYGFLGSLIGQTMTFAGDEFEASTSAKTTALSLTRIGVVTTVLAAALGDRRGRRSMLLWAGVGAVVFAAASALAPNLPALVVAQALSRGLAHAMGLLAFVLAMEEAPAGSRAYVVSLLFMSGGLGSGVAVMAVPLADLGETGWRLIFLLSLAGLPLIAYAARRLPESQRFQRVVHIPQRPPRSKEHSNRLWLLSVTSFAALLFLTPASQLQSDFLHTERDFSATKITVFTLLTAWTAGPGTLIAGKLADLRGRRVVGAVGMTSGAVLVLWHFLIVGWPMWVLVAGGAFLAASTSPTLGVYRAEMFGTARRSEANGMVAVAAVGGSITGLLLAGVLAEWLGGYGPAFSVLIAGPLLVGVLVLAFYPETTRRSLEETSGEQSAPGWAP